MPISQTGGFTFFYFRGRGLSIRLGLGHHRSRRRAHLPPVCTRQWISFNGVIEINNINRGLFYFYGLISLTL